MTLSNLSNKGNATTSVYPYKSSMILLIIFSPRGGMECNVADSISRLADAN